MNGFVKRSAGLLAALLIALSISPQNADASEPTGYDLVVAVNEFRASLGYYPLNPNSLVAQAAQTHAEWIVATGQGGHIGANGSNETDRVSWTGYGGGAAILCDENWASGTNIQDVIYSSWSDWTHTEVMTNQWGNLYTDAGGGVAAQGNGRYVFILNVCKVYGQEYSGSVPAGSQNPPGTENNALPDTSNYIFGVTLATPAADGSITHKVLYGQSLLSIADAYDVSVEKLRELNNMAPDQTIIYTDQELLVVPASGASQAQPTGTPEAQVSPTASTPTQTPQPTPTTPAEVPTTTPPAEDGAESIQLPSLGVAMTAFFGVSLAAFLFFSFKKN